MRHEEKQAKYTPMPYVRRAYIQSEECYTTEELNQRETLLKIRAQSGIDTDYLNNPNPWFTDTDTALMNPYQGSWLYSPAYKPRHPLSNDDFYIQPIDGHRLQWPELYNLMQRTGDYLILRNQQLPQEHLNQPINYILLDVVHMLRGLSQNTNAAQVKKQMELITRYIRTIEKNTPPRIGSDRLFFANTRKIIDDTINPYLTYKIESQLLNECFSDLLKTTRELAITRNTVLHYAFNQESINPHPNDSSIAPPSDPRFFPTLAAKKCAQSSALTTDTIPMITLTGEQLSNCPDFKLITTDRNILNNYAKAISDLNELSRFQKVITEVIDLSAQAGEVYTIHQFRAQMIALLEQIKLFIEDSSQTVETIIHANTQAYHQAIDAEQQLSLIEKYLTTKRQELEAYIKNQDNLAQFPATTFDLAKINIGLTTEVTHIINRLKAPKSLDTSIAAIEDKAQGLNRLMRTMQNWIAINYQTKGIAAPQPIYLPAAPSHFQPLFRANTTAVAEPLPIENMPCTVESNQSQLTPTMTTALLLLPIGALALYLLYCSWNNNESDEILGTQQEFDPLKLAYEDLVIAIKTYEHDAGIDSTEQYIFLLEQYDDIVTAAKSGQYQVGALKEAYKNLAYFYETLRQEQLMI